jgi:hypothetical protein
MPFGGVGSGACGSVRSFYQERHRQNEAARPGAGQRKSGHSGSCYNEQRPMDSVGRSGERRHRTRLGHNTWRRRLTTSRRPAAKRRYARRVTGPRAARNALRHGLSIPVLADPVLTGDIVELAERIANGSTDSQVQECARDVAAAQIDVERVRHARHVLFARPAMGASATEARSDGMLDQLKELWALSRYERRAMSRRKSAIRALQVVLFHSRYERKPGIAIKSCKLAE